MMYGCTFSLSLLLLCFMRDTSAAAVNNNLSTRIVGGNETSIEKHPYMARLEITFDGYVYLDICGASIIDEHHLLTAGHCVKSDSEKSDGKFPLYRVVVGQTDFCEPITGFISNVEFTVNPNFAYVKHFVKPDNTYVSTVNDIAVLKVNDLLPLGIGIQKINIASRDPVVGEMCTVTGWGLTYPLPSIKGSSYGNNKIPCILRELRVPIVPDRNPFCSKNDRKTEICAGYTIDADDYIAEDVAPGDSGGPLLCGGELHGIVSYSGDASVYTKVRAYLPWIQEVIKHWPEQ